MYIVFFSTSNVFKAEEILNRNNIICEIVPTPAQDRAYCGVCIKTEDNRSIELIKEIEHVIVD